MSGKTVRIANALVRSEALKFGSFKLKSGVMSPYYIDLTWLLSSPKDFMCIVDAVVDEIREVLSSRRVDKLASIELKGALLLPSIANKLGLPCLVARKMEKGYGVAGRIAGGQVKEGEHILFFDDVVSSGGSKIEGIKPLEGGGAKVEVVLVVVDREQGGKENLAKEGYELRTVTTISKLANALFESHEISREEATKILEYSRKTTG
ncbi:MAG: orotate phosphoribosyltransferase [Candidatus Bathyarchaeota archaeon]|nr:MAG: orotate phosphoribosyltransferase [Candidatus Bathyarchaeota archaeon]